jgi:hypothetical protein
LVGLRCWRLTVYCDTDFFNFYLIVFHMKKLGNLLADEWIEGDGDGAVLLSAVSGRPLAAITSAGLDFEHARDYARSVGGPNLRKMTFHQRGDMLKAHEQGIFWDDPSLRIRWPVPEDEAVLSPQDETLPLLREIETPFRYALSKHEAAA